jgi:putative Ca2+/H+ antiporter (TMEM165/GDT1 family)
VLLSVALATFPLVAVGELPDKTMFASLLLSARGRPLAVWLGAATAFAVHVAIAVSIGVALVGLLPHRVLEAVVAALFAVGAVLAWRARDETNEAGETVADHGSALRTAATATAVIFLAEWGDLTQVITADLAARTHDPLGVGVGALAALSTVAAVAVVGGAGLMRYVSVRKLRIVTAAVLAVLAVTSLVASLH